MIAIVDYGVGNLFSLRSSFAAIGAEACVTGDAEKILAADRVVLPGVGAFGDAAALLKSTCLDETVREAARACKPLLGICLGMQLLLEQSLEYGTHAGLGLVPGTVRPIRPMIPAEYKVPHIGWNALHITLPEHPLLREVKQGEHMYFVHSFFADRCAPDTLATTEYGIELTAAVARGNVMGCQFHPEKSGVAGLRLLRAFCEMEG